ncbi:tRNA (adenosine(37)-N6)-threonylcarbamoyltransferase complex dimerization subunit type 1 TsaB [Desulfoluna limicola]|uniref:tRNA (Adenosine(37)-N6)-threonylcarbamoyltransferase complex dimerization subunit type 1 TsaB n=1 Tax=Desulfoluna limicola TaxID=2810562 RepID=A0ABN6EZS5_9BACT|nr:tRNA (adenosine(37)-N6)-threonylcarbamoyltransferase complex dimerization subunit type 1 TsaB [Desulfoluna limicola]BCS95809.1 tRNA (adenosine(37)-N6)-threonylcarbamoyltransferase complex dimerization subunit type 1 TsaB [Desulfoluna limicola]
MRLLAVDTSTLSCGVAVADEGGLLSESLFTSKQTHSRHLLGMVEETLLRSGLALSDLDGFSVTRGPGSFTGLRIGMSVVKGLAEVAGKPVAGISTLEALARGAVLANKPILAMVDARKGEVYAALYAPDGKGGVAELSSPEAVSPEALLSRIDGDVLCVGTGAVAYREAIEEALGEKALFAAECNTIRPSVVASLAFEAFRRNDIVSAAAVSPLYLRKSDAEIALELRSASKGHG